MSESNGNGFIETTTESKKTVTLRKCATRLELAGFRSMLEELMQLDGSYRTLLETMQKEQDDPKTPSAKKVELFDSIAALESRFTARTLPVYNRISGELQKKQEKGTPVTELDIFEITEVSTQFLKEQLLSGEERKNS